MKTEDYLITQRSTEKPLNMAETFKTLEEECNSCNPLTLLQCITGCNVWKLKNELRKLYETLEKPCFMTDLLNALKNKRRLQILKIISKISYSLQKIQSELKKLGYQHSQKTILKEYINPLVEVGLVNETRNQYCTTTFGSKLFGLIQDYQNFENSLPTHSECYEEMILGRLSMGLKTYKDLKESISTKSLSRIIRRLQKTGLIETSKERDYVFFFRSRRDMNKEKLSPTEKKVYRSIPEEGIPARKLAKKARISIRRTYRYLRKLKGKKLVFARKSPKPYVLTDKGAEVATMLQRIYDLVDETLTTSAQVANGTENGEMPIENICGAKIGRKRKAP